MIFFYSTCSDVMRFDWGPRGDTELLRGCVHEYIHFLYDRVLQTTSQGQERIDVYIYIQSNCMCSADFYCEYFTTGITGRYSKKKYMYTAWFPIFDISKK